MVDNYFKIPKKTINGIFDKLPPPKPSAKTYGGYGGSGSSSHYSAPVSMSHYNNSCGVCFHESAMVHMADGSLKPISLLKKGDRVISSLQDKKESEVLCMTETSISAEYPFVNFHDGLLVTPYHPIRIGKEWHFPIDLSPPKLHYCKTLYNLVLTKNHIIVVNNIECVTLGHGFQEPVVSHPYFGSEAILQDLAQCAGWESGVVKLRRGCFHRNSETDLIDGIKRDD